MKRKIFLLLMIGLSLFMITGCKSTATTEQAVHGVVFEATVGDEIIYLDGKANVEKFVFPYTTSGALMHDSGYHIVDYSKDGVSFVFRQAVNYYKGKALDSVMSEKTVTSTGTKEYNGITYKTYEGKSQTGEKALYYGYQDGNDTYLITFISNKDLNDLIEQVMNHAAFN